MIRFLLPILVIVIVILAALAFWKYGLGKNPVSQNSLASPATSGVVSSSPVPVTGNPDDIGKTIDNAAQDEGNTVNSQDESTIVNQNNDNASGIVNSINENSY